MSRTRPADPGTMELIEEQEDSAAVDPVLDMHRSFGLEDWEYRRELDDHKLGCWFLTLRTGLAVGWRARCLVAHTLLGWVGSFGLVVRAAAVHPLDRLGRSLIEQNSSGSGYQCFAGCTAHPMIHIEPNLVGSVVDMP